MSAKIVIVSGPPGAGKSTVARQLARNSEGRFAAHLHTDDFYAAVQKGYVAPWLPEAHNQNIVIAQAIVTSAAAFVTGGYDTMIDGIVGPWLIDPWLALAPMDVRYIVLRPDLNTTLARATARSHPTAMTDTNVVETMWRHFSNLGAYERHAVDTTSLAVADTVSSLQRELAAGRFRLE